MLKNKILATSEEEQLFVDDVFSTFVYTGNSSARSINNGIDLAGRGGMVWIKSRAAVAGFGHVVYDTARGPYPTAAYIDTRSTDEQIISRGNDFANLSSFNSNGFSINPAVVQDVINGNGELVVAWTFRNATKFFTHTTVSHINGTATNIALTDLGTVGMVVAKITTTTGDWITWHRSLTAGNNLRLNTIAVQTTTNAWLSVSGATATLASAAPTGTYVIYAWAHDTASDGLIQCGSFTTDGSGNATVNLGWEPQWMMTKSSSELSGWQIFDTMRGWANGGTDARLQAQSAAVESSGVDQGRPTATGFQITGFAPSLTLIYLAIRRPNKPPTSGTQVFQPTVYTGTNTDNRLVNTGILTDMVMFRARSLGGNSGYAGFVVGDRLRGQPWLKTGLTQAETTTADGLDQQIFSTTEYGTAFSSMTGVWVGNNTGTGASNVNINANTTANNHVALAFKRAPGFFDVVAYTGTGANRTVSHNLGAVPELMIVKSRSGTSGASDWEVYFGQADRLLRLNANDIPVGTGDRWNNTQPTASAFSLGNSPTVNGSSTEYVAYLFASLLGISRIGTYTGNGTTQTINCGFTTGARFVLIKRTDDPGDWYVWDTARGIVAGNDPHLSLNTTAAEVTTNDSIDPDASGFIVNQLAATNINVNSASYLYLAIA